MAKNAPPTSILVVDDDASTRRMLTLALSRRGFDVAAARGGDEALVSLRTRPFSILLADIYMPGMDGLALSAIVREIRPEMGLVLMSGFQTEESVLSAFRGGVRAYLRKPLDLPSLYRTLRHVAETLRDLPRREEVNIALGRAPEEAEALLASPELARAGLAYEGDGWVSFEAPSHPAFLERFSNLCELLLTGGMDADTLDELRVAILELGTNAIEWGNVSDERKPMRLSARLLADRIAIVVEDRGPGFRLEDVPNPTENIRELQLSREAAGKRPGGYGIALVRAITDHLVYSERGNVVAMVKRLRPRPSPG